MIKINLLSIRDRVKSEAIKDVLRKAFLILVLCVVWAAYLYIDVAGTYSALNRDFFSMNMQITKLGPDYREVLATKREVDELSEKLDKIKSYSEKSVIIPYFMYTFSKDLFLGGWVDTFKIEESVVKCKAYLKSPALLVQLRKKLLSCPIVSTIKLSRQENVEMAGKSYVKTELEITLRAKGLKDGS